MTPLKPSTGEHNPREGALLERLAVPIVMVTQSGSVLWSNSAGRAVHCVLTAARQARG